MRVEAGKGGKAFCPKTGIALGGYPDFFAAPSLLIFLSLAFAPLGKAELDDVKYLVESTVIDEVLAPFSIEICPVFYCCNYCVELKFTRCISCFVLTSIVY